MPSAGLSGNGRLKRQLRIVRLDCHPARLTDFPMVACPIRVWRLVQLDSPLARLTNYPPVARPIRPRLADSGGAHLARTTALIVGLEAEANMANRTLGSSLRNQRMYADGATWTRRLALQQSRI